MSIQDGFPPFDLFLVFLSMKKALLEMRFEHINNVQNQVTERFMES
jgi:hypothetical protein